MTHQRNLGSRIICVFLLSIFLSDASSAAASDVTDILLSDIHKELKRTVTERHFSEEPLDDIERQKDKAAALLSDKKITLESIDVNLSEFIPEASVYQKIMDEYLGKPVSFQELSVLCDRLEYELRIRGYFAVVYVPTQTLKEGHLRLEVVTSKMEDLHIEGLRYFDQARTLWYWDTPKGETLNMDKLRLSLARMNDNPDRIVKAYVKPGDQTGFSDVFLVGQDRFPMHVGYTLDNRGIKTTGKLRHGLTFKHNNLLKLDDMLLAGTALGDDFGVGYGQYILPVTAKGGRLAFSYSHARVSPQKELSDFDIDGRSDNYSLSYLQNLVRKQNLFVDSYVGIEFNEKSTSILGVTSVRDRLRVLNLGLSTQYLQNDAVVWSADMHIDYALPLYGENSSLRSRDSSNEFFLYALKLERQQKHAWSTHSVLSLEAQLTDRSLPGQKQIFLGGATSVRGYPESDYGADSAILAKAEYWIPCWFLPSTIKIADSPQPLKDQLRILLFTDYGYGHLNDPTSNETKSRNLCGAGVGMDYRFRSNASARMEYAWALGDKALTESGRAQLHFRVIVEI